MMCVCVSVCVYILCNADLHIISKWNVILSIRALGIVCFGNPSTDLSWVDYAPL